MLHRLNSRYRRTVLSTLVLIAVGTISFPASSQDRGSGVPNPEVTDGPDVTVWALGVGNSSSSDLGTEIFNHGAAGGYRAYSASTDSCNVGSAPVTWIGGNSQHPVIAQNMYRLKDGRFKQIGQSWLKHGFLSLNTTRTGCNGKAANGTPTECVGPPNGGSQLGIGCTDLYGSGLNGGRPLGSRSDVNSTTGVNSENHTGTSTDETQQRLRVLETELEVAGATTAQYWIEGQYVTADDAAANNGLNNASHRLVTITPASFNLNADGNPTVRGEPAIHAWRDVDPTVEILPVDFQSGGSGIIERFNVARKVTTSTGRALHGGTSWHYEVVVHNLNSDRAAQGLTLQFPSGTALSGQGFHQAASHSGEIYETTPWTMNISKGAISWIGIDHSTSATANALRWGTSYTFWFDANAPPSDAVWTLDLFAPGTPNQLIVDFEASSIFSDGFESGATGAWSP